MKNIILRKILGSLSVFLFLFVFFAFGYSKTTVYFFYGNGCPHCKKEHKFLEKIKQEDKDIEVKDYEVWYNKENRELLSKVGKACGKSVSGIPFTIIGDKTINGFQNEKITGKEILSAISYCQKNKCEDIMNKIETEKCENNEEKSELNGEDGKKFLINIPFLGEVNLGKFSIPLVAMIIGVVDGFNPCAMRILLFLISMLIGMKDRKKMWILGGTFIFVSAAVYFLFMTARLELIEVLKFVKWLRPGIGIFALIAGGYNLYQYFTTKDKSGCNVVNQKKRTKMFDKIRNIVHEKSFWLALLGISALAISVNIVELFCSAGLPVVFTQILEVNNFDIFTKYSYILLYIFFFMIDDLFVFFVSMKTLQLTGITTKYTKYSHIIGGILMLIIGILLIRKPELLMM